MQKLINVLLFLWQLPQNLIGFLLFLIFQFNVYRVEKLKQNKIYFVKWISGINLGYFIFLGSEFKKDKQHEIGHSKQSLYLGWLYLLIIGLPSLVHAMIYRTGKIKKNYYSFWTEKWADILGGVIR